MLKNIIINARKTEPAPPVYFTELWGTGVQNPGIGGHMIGTNDIIDRSSPVQVGSDTDWSYIYTGTTSVAIKTSGSLFTWGNNLSGQIGDGTADFAYRSSPVQIGTLTNWKKAVISIQNALALKTDGTIWSWGDNQFGALGLGDTINRSSPVQVGTDTDWVDVSTKGAIKSNGTLWTWGLNNSQQLGLSLPFNKFEPIDINRSFTTFTTANDFALAVSHGGTLWSWGLNTNGQLGINNTLDGSRPVQVGIDTNWAKVSAGINHSIGIKTDGTIWTWGANGSGQLAQNDVVSRSNPIQIGSNNNWDKASAGNSFTIAIRTDGTMFSWGTNSPSGQLGANLRPNEPLFPRAAIQRSSPVQIGTRSDWTQVSSGAAHTIALRSDGTIWSWGLNTSRQLGFVTTFNNPRSSPIQIGVSSNWSQVAAGGDNSAAIATDGTLWTWGSNVIGQVGINNTNNVSSPVQVGTRSDWTQVSTRSSTIAVRSDGTIWGWGQNDSGQLGLLNTTNRSSPVQIGNLSNWVSGSIASTINMIMDNSGIIYTSGGSVFNVLLRARAVTDTTNRSSPVQVGVETDWDKFFGGFYPTVQKTNGGVYTLRSFPIQIGTDTDWKILIASDDGDSTNTTKIGIKTNGTLWSWGPANGTGLLGLGDTSARSIPTQVGTDTNWSTLTQIVNNNITAVKTNGTLWAWGSNGAGQLGLGDIINRSSPTQVGTLSTWVSASQYSVITHYIKRYT
jgi:alpha-tubulin suppressor-like RCC1 family protein